MGFPIRKSTDQRVFAPPRSLSQRITSFIACACQGIHQLPLRHLIVLIANTHHAIPKGLSFEQRPVRGAASMELAQKDQLLEIGSRVRLGKPIIGKGLSVPCDKSRPFRTMKFEQIFSLQCQTEQAQSTRLDANSFTNDFFHHLDTNAAISRIAPRRSCGSRVHDNPCGLRIGGAGRDRTDDILLAKQALSQLSYGP